jgi:hypothetical protein
MRGNDRVILIVVPLLALAAAFWFLLISPKRDEASQLQEEIDTNAAALDAAQAQIATAEEARDAFPDNYGELVKLGRAVPEDDDQSTLVYDMAEMGDGNELDFRGFVVVPGSGDPVTAPAEPTPTASAADESEERVEEAAAEEEPAPAAPAEATEAAAAALPIGATVGPAGLPVQPYEFKYTGDFFNVADFLGDVDKTVTTKSGEPVVHGRLMTVDGFSLIGDLITGFPNVEANFAITTYIVPPGQGITGGATPAGPAPTGSTSPTPVSTPTTTSTPATAAATP